MGKVHVASFFFASCKGICVDMSNNLRTIQGLYENQSRLKVISYSVDPERDTLEALKAYAEQHEAIDGRWHFLTGSKQALEAQGKGYFLTAMGENGIFDHSPRFALVDATGVIRGYYDGTNVADMRILQNHIGYLFWEMDNLKEQVQ
jgi:protein SCO1/2